MSDDAEKKKKTQGPGKSMLVRTLLLLIVCGFAAFVVLAFRLYDVQITNNGHYETLALNAQLRHTTIAASRGTIYDTNGKILAMSAAVENVFISPLEIERKDQDLGLIADGLSAILGVEREYVLDCAARTHSQYQIIKLRVESGEAAQVRDFISDNGLSGIYLEPNSKRYYPNDRLACQILGFVGTDNIGLDGLEQRFDGYLNGVDGRTVRLTNARGADLRFSDFEDHYSAQHGDNITLTIESSIQYYVEKHLEQAIEDYNVLNGATCIAMGAKTGAILAIANYPNFDPNDFLSLGDRDIERLGEITDEEAYREAVRLAQFRQWRNRALADSYEPGSVFKIITLAMALEENLASPQSSFDCKGLLDNITGRSEEPLRCWRRWGHGTQTLNEAIQNSCNIACVELGFSIGARTFYRYVDAFGLFNKTGLDTVAEGRSIWWSEDVFFERGNNSQLASAAFGQTFNVTPIQMITAVASTINGGYLMQPYIVQQITDSNGNVIESAEPTVVRQVISAETSAVVRQMLENVVTTGTGKNARVRGYRVGGKTGTSEDVVGIATSEEGAQKDYIVSFVGFAPADDPEIIILLLLDTPHHSAGINITGGAMAAPVVGNMLADILPLSLGIRPNYTADDIKDINVDVPRITGGSVEDAKNTLQRQGLEFSIVGEGENVTGQLPAPNSNVASGTTVIIYAGEEAPRIMVTVPELQGLSYSAAKSALETRGMFIRTTGAPKSDSSVRVSVQSMPSGRETMYGSVVEVTLIDRDVY